MIETERLLLKPMNEAHLGGLIAMNADPKVMAHFSAPVTPAGSTTMLAHMQTHWAKNGFGYCALIQKDTEDFIGFTGLTRPPYETAFSPCVEIGWRLQHAAWHKGYAFEAANACFEWGFGALGLNEIVSFTARQNRRSIALMQRLGMASDPSEDFEHPMLALGHPLSWHVLYRLTKP